MGSQCHHLPVMHAFALHFLFSLKMFELHYRAGFDLCDFHILYCLFSPFILPLLCQLELCVRDIMILISFTNNYHVLDYLREHFYKRAF